MGPVILPALGNRALAARLSGRLGMELGSITARQFPDGEHYLRVDTPVAGRDIAIACTLARPDETLLPLLLLAATARDLGARSVGLVAPYLAFMRQDERFAAGEGITSVYVAKLLSDAFDWLVTVDPHLHRWSSLDAFYTTPTRVVQSAPAIAAWVETNVERPLLVGPDAESAQWVERIGAISGAPSLILEKVRRGDREVAISVPDLEEWSGHTPVVIDDIISTGMTMLGTLDHLAAAGVAHSVCIGVHAVFAGDAYRTFAGRTGKLVTCNTVTHSSNEIAVDDLLADAVRDQLASS